MTAPFQTLRTPFLVQTRQFPLNEKEFPNTMAKVYYDIASAVNSREISIYETFQTNTGQRWFNTGDPTNKLQAFRTCYVLPSIANGVNSIPVSMVLDTNTQFVNIYGTANSPSTGFSIPLPYVNVTTPGDEIELRVNWNTSSIEIVTSTANWTTFSAIVVLEYIEDN